MATDGDNKRNKKEKKMKKNDQREDNKILPPPPSAMAAADDNKRDKKKKKMKKNNQQEHEEATDIPVENKKKTKGEKKRKLQQQEEVKVDDGSDHEKQTKNGHKNKRSKHNVVTDERFASFHSDPRFQSMPKKESKVSVDAARFARMLKDDSFVSSSAPVDKRGRPKKEKETNPLHHYYEEEGGKKEGDEDEERESGSETEVLGDENSSTDDDEEEDYDSDDEQDLIQSDIVRYLMADHDDTPSTEEETCRLAVVNMDWDNIKAVDLYVAISSCLPKSGQILSVGIYPSEYGLKCMEVEAVHGPSALINNKEEHSDTESESEDEDLLNEKLRSYELNKLRYYYGVAVFDSSATANHVYSNLDGNELLRTSNVFDLRFIPDSMEFNHPPRDIIKEAPTNYNRPDFLTRALQHSKVKLTWEEDEPHRTKTLRRKFDAEQLDELNEYLASSGDSDASEDEEGDDVNSENEDAGDLPNGKPKKHNDKEKLRALLLSGDGSGSDRDDDNQDMEITFNTGLEDLSKRILEKKDKKEETVWKQALRKGSEKRKSRKNRSKDSSDDDSSDSDVQEAAPKQQPDDFFMEEDKDLDSGTETGKKKKKVSKRGQRREESSDKDREQEASKAELELLFADDQDGKAQNVKGYNLKSKRGKGKKGKETLMEEAKLPDVDLLAAQDRFPRLRTPLFALDPTDSQFKRSATYARQQARKRGTVVKGTAHAEEVADAGNGSVPLENAQNELSSMVRSLKRNLGNLKKGPKK